MITYLLNQALLVAFNWGNSRLDAYRITRHKVIAHALNLLAYAAFTGLLSWIFRMGWEGLLFGASAFFNRQLSFDIPLNVRRGLRWYYQSTAESPKALMDRLERKIFGHLSGKVIAAIYSAGWLICLLIKMCI